MKTPRFVILGMPDRIDGSWPQEAMHVIRNGCCFSGGNRHYELVKHLLPYNAEWIPITIPVSDVMAQYAVYEEVIVFASGDPVFYGIANTIQRYYPEADMMLYPSHNALQMLAHRLLMNYADMRIVTLTGRPWHELDRAVIERVPKLGILTDKVHTPQNIAARLLDYGYADGVMHIGERLGNPALEKVQSLSIQEVVNKTYAHPNCIILQLDYSHIKRPFGIPESDFHLLDGRVNMITKAPIRLLTLNLLDLHDKQQFWDVGFCTGSISIEAKKQFPHLHITSFEIRQAGQDLIRLNARRHHVPGIRPIVDDFMTVDLSSLTKGEGYATPDAVFIGGHGGALVEMVGRIMQVLADGGVLVFNAVSEKSQNLFREAVAQQENLVIVQEMCIAIDEHNPIVTMKAVKVLSNK